MAESVLLQQDDGKFIKARGSLKMTHTRKDIGNTSVQVVAANSARKYLLIINDSDEVMYLRLATTSAETNKGIRLDANGGSIEMSLLKGNLYRGRINAIRASDEGTKYLLVTEGE